MNIKIACLKGRDYLSIILTGVNTVGLSDVTVIQVNHGFATRTGHNFILSNL